MGKFKTLLVIILSITITGVGVTFYVEKDALGFGSDKGTSAAELAELSIDTDVITTNLTSNNFAIVQFNILLDSKEAKEELAMRTAEVRAAIISTLAGFTKDQLNGTEGITNLEKELILKLKAIVETGNIERVLVTEFKIQ